MEFSPNNKIVKLCIQGMAMEDESKPEEAHKTFMLAWDEATNDFEKFLAAHYIARQQNNASDHLKWLEIALQLALKINSTAVEAAFPSLYANIAECYEKLGNPDKAKINYQLAASSENKLSDKGPFYHGTKADLQVGDFLTAGKVSNYQSDIIMNHIYFTALSNGAGLAAALAKGDGQERVYQVEPTGSFENDPNLTNKKFPGNPSRSYRTQAPLKIIGEVTDWMKQSENDIQKWKEKLDKNKGKIIN